MTLDKRIVPVVLEKGAQTPAIIAPYLGIDLSDRSTLLDKLNLLADQIKLAGSSEHKIDAERDIEKLREETLKVIEMREEHGEAKANRETYRKFLASMIAAMTCLVFVVIIVGLIKGGSFNGLLQGAGPALIGVLGVSVGYYFGSARKSRD